MKFNKRNIFKMDMRVYVVFILVVSVAIANAVLSTIKIRNNKNTIFEITQYTNPTLENLEEFNLLVTRSRMFISNWVYLPNNYNDKTNLVQLNKVAYPTLKNKLIDLTRGWEGNGNIEKVNKLFIEYESVIREQEKIMKSLVKFDDYQDPMRKFLAEEQLESEIIPKTNRLIVKMRELIILKKEEARHLQNDMLQDNVHLLMIVFSMAILVILSVMMAGAYLMKKVILPLLKVKDLLLRMSAGELPELKPAHEHGALEEMKMALFQLREGLQRTSSFAEEIGRGNFNAGFEPLSDKDVLGSKLLEMRDKLKQAADDDAIRSWASEGYAQISAVLNKNTEDIRQLSDEIISGLINYIRAQRGVIYITDENQDSELNIERLSLIEINPEPLDKSSSEWHQGLIRKAVSGNTRIYLPQINNDSAKATGKKCDILILPLFSAGRVIGALEIMSIDPLSKTMINFIEKIAEPVAANILNLKANLLTRQLLVESRIKTRELALQDEELRQINNELLVQSGKLKESESTLIKQQDILQKVNSELENKALLLEEKNMAVEDAHKALAFKAEQLEKSNKYKSDFLANMSHELRTPLNSVLILAKLLGENKSSNMTEKQVEHAKVIHKSGSDLLIIINDILDLSKIEAGKLQIQKEQTSVHEICNNMMQLFMEVSKDKQIHFALDVDPNLLEFIYTDRIRTEQILKNLLGNAFKFTAEGGQVTLKVSTSVDANSLHARKLLEAGKLICFSVIDSGIGIPDDKQKLIFDAFNQADGSITRKFGGTGLGLAICRQLSYLLGGEITLQSEFNKGSVFNLYLSADQIEGSSEKELIHKSEANHTVAGNVLLLCNDIQISETWRSLLALENYEVTTTPLQQMDSVDFKPAFVIIDATLSDIDYTRRVERLSSSHHTQDTFIFCRSVSEFIPAEIISRVKLHTTAAVTSTLITTILEKVNSTPSYILRNETEINDTGISGLFPASDESSSHFAGLKILIADDDIRNIYSLTSVFENEGAEVIYAMDGFEAIEQFHNHPDISLILMDIMMPGKDGLQAIREIRQKCRERLPIIAVTAKAMRDDKNLCMDAGASDYITKPVDLEILISKVNRLIKKQSL